MAERRRFYRVQDEVLMNWQTLAPEDVSAFRRGVLRTPIKKESLQALVSRLDTRIEELGEQMHAIDPVVREAIDLLDRKLTLIERMLVRTTEAEVADYTTMQVNLSAGGLRFDLREPLEVGTLLALDMVLLPEYEQVEMVAEVVSSQQRSRPPRWRTAVDFVQMREVDRDRLAGHVARRQTEILKAAREQA